MCGLNCIISKSGRPIDIGALKNMNDLIFHRGPDDEGFFSEEWIGLGFRRLSIIDVGSGGYQPMFDSSGRYVCVFNGEIYNYIELREQLKSYGVVFKTNSDTEVLIQAYIHWGADCLAKFIGMFAIIIVDRNEKSVFIARDQLGIKPLSYTEDKDLYYFSSEIKAFQAVTKLSPDPDTYFEQFIFRYVSGERTNFSNVKKVLPGHYLSYSNLDKKFITHQYFNLRDQFFDRSSATQVENISEHLRESFLLHTRSDVGYSLQLSGGVDSSYLTSVISDNVPNELMTFSIKLNDQKLDESRYQDLVARQYNTKHYAIELDVDDYYEHLKKATYHMDAPIVHGGCVFLMLLCQEIKNHTKVVLTGEGADELFAGYQRYVPTWQNNIAQLLRKIHVPNKFVPALWKLKGLKHFMSDDLIYYSHKYNDPASYENIFSHLSQSSSYRKSVSSRSDMDYLQATQYYDQTTYLSSLLDRQDKMSMSASVEARVPYCNPELFRQINPIHSNLKLQKGRTKTLLKNCASKAYSDDFLNRKKNGLLLPYERWLKEHQGMSEYIALLTDTVAKNRGIYNQQSITLALDRFSKGETQFIKPLLSLVHMEVWHRVFDL